MIAVAPVTEADVKSCRVLILAGGLGSRLSSVVADRPKVLAPVAGRTFLDVLVARLFARGVRRIALLLGHMHDQVERHVADRLQIDFPDATFTCCVEDAPLGTAGALRHAHVHGGLVGETSLLMNGDTYFEFDPAALLTAHHVSRAIVTLATRVVADSGRYGAVDVAPDGRVQAFREKDPSAGAGAINAGVYVVEPRLIDQIPDGRAVSLENEIFPALLGTRERIQAVAQDGHFVDIGTAESYSKFETWLRSNGT